MQRGIHIFALQMLTCGVLGDSSMFPPEGAASRPATASPVRMRRRWVFRTSSLLLATAIGLCIVVIWQRDKLTVRDTLRQMEPTVTALQEQVKAFGWLPSKLPTKSSLNFQWYADDDVRLYATNTREPVLVAHTVPIELVLHHNGRCAIIYQDGTVHAAWLPLARFNHLQDEQKDKLEAFEAARRARPPQLPE